MYLEQASGWGGHPPGFSTLSHLQAVSFCAAAGNSGSLGFAGKTQTLTHFDSAKEEVSSQQGIWGNTIFRFQSAWITSSEVLPAEWLLTTRQSLLPWHFPWHSQSPRMKRSYHPPRNNSLSFQNIWECFLILRNESSKCFLFPVQVEDYHLYFCAPPRRSAVIVVNYLVRGICSLGTIA